MKRTRKWAFVAQEATRLHALGLKPSEIAEKLGVNKSTVTRWIADGRLPRREEASNAAGEKRTVLLEWKEKTAAQWAAAVRDDYDLSETDEQLVTLAESALLLSRDPMASASTRLQAMGRFQALTRQLGLETRRSVEEPSTEPEAEPEQPKAAVPVVKRTGTDPRALFVVKG